MKDPGKFISGGTIGASIALLCFVSYNAYNLSIERAKLEYKNNIEDNSKAINQHASVLNGHKNAIVELHNRLSRLETNNSAVKVEMFSPTNSTGISTTSRQEE